MRVGNHDGRDNTARGPEKLDLEKRRLRRLEWHLNFIDCQSGQPPGENRHSLDPRRARAQVTLRVTFVPPTLGPFLFPSAAVTLFAEPKQFHTMKLMKPKCRRKQDRVRAVLPVRVRGKDTGGTPFEAAAHTLDLTQSGARLGAIHRQITAHDTLVVLFQNRRLEFTVMWTRSLDGREYQVGLRAMAKESDPWSLNVNNKRARMEAA